MSTCVSIHCCFLLGVCLSACASMRIWLLLTPLRIRQAFVRFDLSEYQEKHEVAKLIGSPPGAVPSLSLSFSLSLSLNGMLLHGVDRRSQGQKGAEERAQLSARSKEYTHTFSHTLTHTLSLSLSLSSGFLSLFEPTRPSASHVQATSVTMMVASL
jgi:hypothetical protein